MKNKAIIFDLDGTAVDSPHQKLPSQRLVKAINALRDSYHLCAATGRVWGFAKPVIQALQLKDSCIISAGSQICNPETGETIWQMNIENKAVEKAINVFKKNPQYRMLYNDGTFEEYLNGGISPNDFNTDEPVYFLEQVFIPEGIAYELQDELNKIDGVICAMAVAMKDGHRDLHVTNQNATKEHAIAELLNMIGVDVENTIGIGDSYNDLHLYNGVSTKIAMGNAVEKLKERADKVIGSVDEDGLAKYFEELK